MLEVKKKCLVVDAAYEQSTNYEKLIKEAWLVSLFENSTSHLRHFNYTRDDLTAATMKLMDGTVIDKLKNQDFTSMKIRNHIALIQADLRTALYFQALKDAWDSLKATDDLTAEYIRTAYVFDSPFPPGEKDKLYAPEPESKYPKTIPYHSIHSRLRKYSREMIYYSNYYDFFFLDFNGWSFYTCTRSLTAERTLWRTRPTTGLYEYGTSGLGKTFRVSLADPYSIYETSWEPCAPSNGALASFASSGVLDANGNLSECSLSRVLPWTPSNLLARPTIAF